MGIMAHDLTVPTVKALAFRSNPHPAHAVLLDRIDTVGETCRNALQRTRRSEVALLPAFTVIDGQVALAVACPKVAVTVKTQRTHLLVDNHRQPAHTMATEMQHREVALAREPEVVLVVDERFLNQRYAGLCCLTTM